MKEYNCPDCERTDSCIDCYRVTRKVPSTLWINKDWPDSKIWRSYDYIPSWCEGCANHPRNGGPGICFCTLGTSLTT